MTVFNPIIYRYSVANINSGLYQTISISNSSSGNTNLQIGSNGSLSQGYIWLPYIMSETITFEKGGKWYRDWQRNERKEKIDKLNKLNLE